MTFGKPKIDIDKLREWKESVVGKHTGGLADLAKQRKVQVVHGVAKFTSPNSLDGANHRTARRPSRSIHAIIAAGSSVARIPGFPYDDPRIIDSTGALALQDVPKRMLIIGGGIIGLEMATVYDALGSKITVVELVDGLIPGADRDLVRPLHKRIEKRYEAIYLKTKVTKIEAQKDGLKVTFEGEQAPEPQLYDRVLMAVGRRPNGREIDAEAAGASVNERGFIPVDKQMRTNVPHIFAIGDIVGDPMLAHKAAHEGKVAAEVIAGHKAFFEPLTIPSVAYTDPEIAWMGLTETQAKAQGIEYEKASFPWAASGARCPSRAKKARPSCCSTRKPRRILGCGHRRRQCRRTDRRRRCWRWRWARTWKTSASRSTRTRRCRKRGLRGRDGGRHDHRPACTEQENNTITTLRKNPTIQKYPTCCLIISFAPFLLHCFCSCRRRIRSRPFRFQQQGSNRQPEAGPDPGRGNRGKESGQERMATSATTRCAFPLPESLQKADGTLRKFGMAKYSDELITSMNRAAEAAVPEATTLLADAVRKMTVNDAKGILTGNVDAATQYFRTNTETALTDKFKPIVNKAMQSVKVAEKYDRFAGKGVKFGLVDKRDARLDDYITRKALDGLFLMMAEQEKAIRANPLEATSDLAKKVFSAIRH